ncbi:MAG: SUMF1/EgtB/PvdO family nonheme iron enzyme, partial [Gemmatimonadaceae bacterium]|nr:SUMF1/EgtB/PvdO family nonheme iron enzyme [Gemmatimonadaceae bacterium]
DRTEVSARAYAACVAAGACASPGTGPDATGASGVLADHPINYVSWIDADAYCTWRGARLPTEAEWEHAARPDGRTYPWGDEAPAANLLNACGAECSGGSPSYTDPYVATAPVGSFPDGASPFGVLDMAGNVWEWVGDWYDPSYYAVSPAVDPPGPSAGSRRVRRGGSYRSSGASLVRAAIRQYDDPTYRNPRIGFRCASGM